MPSEIVEILCYNYDVYKVTLLKEGQNTVIYTHTMASLIA